MKIVQFALGGELRPPGCSGENFLVYPRTQHCGPVFEILRIHGERRLVLTDSRTRDDQRESALVPAILILTSNPASRETTLVAVQPSLPLRNCSRMPGAASTSPMSVIPQR